MTPTHATQTAQHVLTGATIGGGVMEWVTLNSSFITVSAVALTSIASIAFGVINARANTMRNRINKRNIVEDLIEELEDDVRYTTEDIKKALRK